MSTHVARPIARSPLTVPGNLLFAARAVWVIVTAFGVAVFIATLPVYYTHTLSLHGNECCLTRHPTEWRAGLHQIGLSPQFYAWFNVGSGLVVASAMFLIGILIFVRKSEEWIGLFISIVLVSFGVVSLNTEPVGFPHWVTVGADALNNVAYVSFFIIPFVFPDGRFVPRWTRWMVAIALVPALGSTVAPNTPLDVNAWPGALSAIFGSGFALTILGSPIYRYLRVSDRTQREQTKWVMYVLVLAIAVFILSADIIPNISGITASPVQAVLVDFVTEAITGIAFLLIPVGFGVAILRYRLWDVDILINRTLVYGSLTVTLGALYIGGVILLQTIFRAITGQRSEIAVAIATLAVAALFNPWRGRLQHFIDRRFYRRKYDAAQTLVAFQATLRGDVDLEHLQQEMLSVVTRTVQPSSVSLWLPEEGQA